MKILLVNKFNFPQGGADTYYLDLCRLLEENGHTVARFCMHHPKNQPTSWDKYFVSHVDYNEGGIFNRIKGALRIFYSREARKNFELLLRDFHPDIIHIHNIYHQISPSILYAAKSNNIPVVMHLHDYKILSPNYSLFSNKKIYDRCIGGHYWRCIPDKCFKNSTFKSALVAMEMYLHHNIMRVYEENVALFAVPSQFLASLLMKYRPELTRNIRVVSNAVDEKKFTPNTRISKNYFLAYGRLTYEKGFDTVIRAYSLLKSREKKLIIVGTGPEEQNLECLINELGLGSFVQMPGPLYGNELVAIIQGSFAVIVPSRWYEVFGLTNTEAMACGRPVIASAIGAIPDIVRNEENGLLFQPNDPIDLSEKMAILIHKPEKADFLGKNGRIDSECRFSSRIHLGRIEALYREALRIR